MDKLFHERRLLPLMAVMSIVMGCGDPKSSSTSGPDGGAVPTSKMTLRLRVEAKDTTTAVARANLNDGKIDGVSYRLDGGDFFRACVVGVCRSMADNDSIYNPDYIARFAYQPGVDFVVSFNRQEDRNAPDSRVVLPLPFSIVTPVNHQPVTDGDVVMVTWSPAGPPARAYLDYTADCSTSAPSDLFATGTLTNDAGSDGKYSVSIDRITPFLKPSTPGVIVRKCSIAVKVSHELVGRVDPAFRGGTAVGVVSREVTLDYVPR